jgi:type IV pilus assembly protein PilO
MKLPSLFKRKSSLEKLAEREAKKTAPEAQKPKTPLIDFRQIGEDFRTLDPKDPGLWPVVPKTLILLSLFAALLTAAWWFGWNVQMEELGQKTAEETKLKEDWVGKRQQAVNLEAYKAQLTAIDTSFGILLRQLPNKSEIGDLLVDINKAAQGRGLIVELFKPAPEAPQAFYSEVPIALQLTGTYHDLGAFAGDIAQLPRIVTLNEIEIAMATGSGTNPGDNLTFKSKAKTFRYLDEAELAASRKATRAKGPKK